MPRKASGDPKVKRVERLQSNGDIYIYEVTTRYNPEKRNNEHISSKLLGKKSPDGTGILPTRPRKDPGRTKLLLSARQSEPWISWNGSVENPALMMTFSVPQI